MSEQNLSSQSRDNASRFLKEAQDAAYEQPNNSDWTAVHMVLKLGTKTVLGLLRAIRGDQATSAAVAKGVNAIHHRQGVKRVVSPYDIESATKALENKVQELDPEEKESGEPW